VQPLDQTVTFQEVKTSRIHPSEMEDIDAARRTNQKEIRLPKKDSAQQEMIFICLFKKNIV
jgi:hypothetical protein